MGISHTTTGSIFDDLGLGKEEAANLKIRARLMDSLIAFVEERSLTQAEAAEHFGVGQPRISLLLSGSIDKFTIDALINMHAAAGIPVTLDIGVAA